MIRSVLMTIYHCYIHVVSDFLLFKHVNMNVILKMIKANEGVIV